MSAASSVAPSSPSSSPLSSCSSTTSSPLSNLSRTPSLPGSPVDDTDPSRRYPSPISTTTTSGTQSPVKLGVALDAFEMRSSDDGPPPAKKRKTAAPKERTTKYLDLTKPNDEFTAEDNFQMERLVSALHKRKKVVVIAGAGISVSAGIPDFRSSTGLFASVKSQHNLKGSGKHLFDASVYRHDSSTQSFHAMVREMAKMTKDAQPTPFHHLLASLAQEGRLLRLYSQNIDCIDTSMKPLETNVPLNPKGPWPNTIQLHGGLQKMVCTKCAQLEPFNAELFDGPQAPLCEACKVQDEVRTAHAGKRSHGIGRLRPRFVLYNEFNPDEEAIGNVSSSDLKTRPDAVIVVGTTLKVPGTRRLVKEMCQVARGRKDGFTAWINVDSEPKGAEFKDCWDMVVRSKCDSVARLAALPPWDCNIGDDYLVSKEEDRESQERLSKTTFEVNVPANQSKAEPKTESRLEVRLDSKPRHIEGILTPQSSPKISATKQPSKKTQSKISFGRKQTDAKPNKPVKQTKPRSRKPKQKPAQVEALNKTVMQTFKPGKNVANREVVKGAGGKAGDIVVPVKQELDVPFGLPPLRPQKTDVDGAELKRRSSEGSGISEMDFGSVSTPTHERRLSGGTISPPSVPRNMRELLHME